VPSSSFWLRRTTFFSLLSGFLAEFPLPGWNSFFSGKPHSFHRTPTGQQSFLPLRFFPTVPKWPLLCGAMPDRSVLFFQEKLGNSLPPPKTTLPNIPDRTGRLFVSFFVLFFSPFPVRGFFFWLEVALHRFPPLTVRGVDFSFSPVPPNSWQFPGSRGSRTPPCPVFFLFVEKSGFFPPPPWGKRAFFLFSVFSPSSPQKTGSFCGTKGDRRTSVPDFRGRHGVRGLLSRDSFFGAGGVKPNPSVWGGSSFPSARKWNSGARPPLSFPPDNWPFFLPLFPPIEGEFFCGSCERVAESFSGRQTARLGPHPSPVPADEDRPFVSPELRALFLPPRKVFSDSFNGLFFFSLFLGMGLVAGLGLYPPRTEVHVGVVPFFSFHGQSGGNLLHRRP